MHCCHRTKVIQLCFTWWRWRSCAQMMRGHLFLRIPVLTALPCLVESPAGSGHCRWYQAAGGENGPTDGPLWTQAGRHCRALWTAQRRQQRKQRSREASRAVVPELSAVWRRIVASERQTDQWPAGQHQSENGAPGSTWDHWRYCDKVFTYKGYGSNAFSWLGN
jgi:hypothetical protein